MRKNTFDNTAAAQLSDNIYIKNRYENMIEKENEKKSNSIINIDPNLLKDLNLTFEQIQDLLSPTQN